MHRVGTGYQNLNSKLNPKNYNLNTVSEVSMSGLYVTLYVTTLYTANTLGH